MRRTLLKNQPTPLIIKVGWSKALRYGLGDMARANINSAARPLEALRFAERMRRFHSIEISQSKIRCKRGVDFAQIKINLICCVKLLGFKLNFVVRETTYFFWMLKKSTKKTALKVKGTSMSLSP